MRCSAKYGLHIDEIVINVNYLPFFEYSLFTSQNWTRNIIDEKITDFELFESGHKLVMKIWGKNHRVNFIILGLL